ncbi:MAG: hypothetical protein HYZ42_10255 [Bacteroidetes bacterium]|nr:hypothetical protein [Bacteroidota bacterium]
MGNFIHKYQQLLLISILLIADATYASIKIVDTNSDQIFRSAKIEGKQILIEVLNGESENSLMGHTEVCTKFKNSINSYTIVKGSKAYLSYKSMLRGCKFLLISNDKQLKSYINTYDLLLVNNKISLFFSTLNIKNQIDYLLKTNHTSSKKAEKIIATYYAKHDKKKYPDVSLEYFLKIYTLDKTMFKEFQKSYIEIWSKS